MWILSRRRKTRMLRRKMLRRKPDPRTGKHTCASLRSRNAHTHTHVTSHKSHFLRKFRGKVPYAIPRHPFCASLRSRNAHVHVTGAILYGKLQAKCRTPIPRLAFCGNAHGHVTIAAILYGKLQAKCRTPIPRPKSTWIFHKTNFVWKLGGKMPNAPAATSMEHRAFTLAIQCGHTVWGTSCYTEKTKPSL